MSQGIPILFAHDVDRKIGQLVGNIVTFAPRTVTAEMMFECGWRTLEFEIVGTEKYITRAEIVELSVGVERPREP